MPSFVVMQGPDRTDSAYVRDGFHFWAFLLGPIWLLWNRLWIEALLLFAAMLAVGMVTAMAGAPQAAPWLSLLLSVFVGLEGSALQLAALRRRGWKDAGVVIAENADEAEIRHVHSAETIERPLAAPPMPVATGASPLRSAQPGPALGLLSYPGSH